MKKNILILSLSLCIFLTAQPVYAVKLAPVNAPNSGPLQPIPEGVEPNIKSNIQDKTQRILEKTTSKFFLFCFNF